MKRSFDACNFSSVSLSIVRRTESTTNISSLILCTILCMWKTSHTQAEWTWTQSDCFKYAFKTKVCVKMWCILTLKYGVHTRASEGLVNSKGFPSALMDQTISWSYISTDISENIRIMPTTTNSGASSWLCNFFQVFSLILCPKLNRRRSLYKMRVYVVPSSLMVKIYIKVSQGLTKIYYCHLWPDKREEPIHTTQCI